MWKSGVYWQEWNYACHRQSVKFLSLFLDSSLWPNIYFAYGISTASSLAEFLFFLFFRNVDLFMEGIITVYAMYLLQWTLMNFDTVTNHLCCIFCCVCVCVFSVGVCNVRDCIFISKDISGTQLLSCSVCVNLSNRNSGSVSLLMQLTSVTTSLKQIFLLSFFLSHFLSFFRLIPWKNQVFAKGFHYTKCQYLVV